MSSHTIRSSPTTVVFEADGVKKVATVEELYKASDFLSLHIPATEQTKGSIGYELLMSMPKGATLVNTARKEVIDEAGRGACADRARGPEIHHRYRRRQSGRAGREVRQAGSSPRPRRWAPRPPRPTSMPVWLLPARSSISCKTATPVSRSTNKSICIIGKRRVRKRPPFSPNNDNFMVRIKPFRADPSAEGTCRRGGVASLRRAELRRRRKARRRERSLLHIIKPEIDFEPIADEHSEQVYEKAVENFRKWQSEGMAPAGPRGVLLYLCADDGGAHAVRTGDVLPLRGLPAREPSRSTS